jgi:hypothetical protein
MEVDICQRVKYEIDSLRSGSWNELEQSYDSLQERQLEAVPS